MSNEIEQLQAMRLRLLLKVLGDCETVLADEKRDLKEKQRTQRIVLEAIDKISKMKDLGSNEDDFAKLLQRLKTVVEKGNGNGKTEKKGENGAKHEEVHA